jgi:hypothetical protein
MGMTKTTTGMIVGFGAALAGWWIYLQRESQENASAAQGEVIFSNAPRVD